LTCERASERTIANGKLKADKEKAFGAARTASDADGQPRLRRGLGLFAVILSSEYVSQDPKVGLANRLCNGKRSFIDKPV
jgi:hypothetical protein